MVLEPMAAREMIFDAWNDEPWVIDGAAVRVSLVCFGNSVGSRRLNGEKVGHIFPDLTSGTSDFTKTIPLRENTGVAARGIERGGDFDISGNLAREFVTSPLNVNRRPNSDVVKRFLTVADVTDRLNDSWIIDFFGCDEQAAAAYELPFAHLQSAVLETRRSNNESRTASRWWLFRRTGAEFRIKSRGLARLICTPLVSKYRIFVFVEGFYIPDTRVVTIFRIRRDQFRNTLLDLPYGLVVGEVSIPRRRQRPSLYS